MDFDWSWMKATWSVSRPASSAAASTAVLHAVDRLDEVGAGALLDLDGHRRLAVDAGDRGRVLEGRADLGDVAERRRVAVVDAATGMLSTSSGVSISAGTLTAKRPLCALERAGGDQAVALRRGRDEVVERDAVALEQHRLGDDLDHLVARALAGRPRARPAPARSPSPPRARSRRARAPTGRRRAPPRSPGRG